MKDYDPEALRLANQVRAKDERVLWAGRAKHAFQPGPMFWQTGGLLIVAIVSVAWNYITDPPIFYEAWQYFVPAILIGPFAIIFAVVVFIEWRRRGAIYAVTNERVLILEASGAVRESVLLSAGRFSRDGRAILLVDAAIAVEDGKGDLDGGLKRFANLPRLRGLRDPDAVLAIIHGAGGRR